MYKEKVGSDEKEWVVQRNGRRSQYNNDCGKLRKAKREKGRQKGGNYAVEAEKQLRNRGAASGERMSNDGRHVGNEETSGRREQREKLEDKRGKDKTGKH